VQKLEKMGFESGLDDFVFTFFCCSTTPLYEKTFLFLIILCLHGVRDATAKIVTALGAQRGLKGLFW
jgi:hypothetical protein